VIYVRPFSIQHGGKSTIFSENEFLISTMLPSYCA